MLAKSLKLMALSFQLIGGWSPSAGVGYLIKNSKKINNKQVLKFHFKFAAEE